MARRYKYLGPDCNLGRHGAVRSGAILEIRENEIHQVAASRDFVLVDEERGTLTIMPRDVEAYALTSLPWGTASITRSITRLGRKQLESLAAAMGEVLSQPLCVSHDMGRDAMAERILGLAGDAGWI